MVILALFLGSGPVSFASTKPVSKQSNHKSSVATKKVTTKKNIKKKVSKKTTKKNKKKEKLILNPPLIDPLNPPGGR